MFKLLISSALVLMSISSFAQNTPVGLWKNIDDKTGEAKAEIRIKDNGERGLFGVIERSLVKEGSTSVNCDLCTDDRKGKPKIGLEIIRGAKKDGDENVWTGGKILDPENGKEYTLKLTPQDGGKKLAVRGSIGPFGRTQTWVRVQ